MPQRSRVNRYSPERMTKHERDERRRRGGERRRSQGPQGASVDGGVTRPDREGGGVKAGSGSSAQGQPAGEPFLEKLAKCYSQRRELDQSYGAVSM